MLLEEEKDHRVINAYHLGSVSSGNSSSKFYQTLAKNAKILSIKKHNAYLTLFAEENPEEEKYEREFIAIKTGNGLPKRRSYGWRFLDTVYCGIKNGFVHVFIRVI